MFRPVFMFPFEGQFWHKMLSEYFYSFSYTIRGSCLFQEFRPVFMFPFEQQP